MPVPDNLTDEEAPFGASCVLPEQLSRMLPVAKALL